MLLYPPIDLNQLDADAAGPFQQLLDFDRQIQLAVARDVISFTFAGR
jgi:hypothetical protein